MCATQVNACNLSDAVVHHVVHNDDADRAVRQHIRFVPLARCDRLGARTVNDIYRNRLFDHTSCRVGAVEDIRDQTAQLGSRA
jgi:hypothetical protein